MNGIDTVVASLLASRVDSLLSGNAAGDALASRTGASSLNVDTPAVSLPLLSGSGGPQASAQTALSAVALTLDAIVRSGGEATPAVVGQTPVWPNAPVPASIPLSTLAAAARLSVPLPLFDGAASSSGEAAASSSAASQLNASTAQPTTASAATSAAAAAQWPVAALAAALEQTVADSGLFYEAHLVQWLAGQRSPAALAGEPQNRLATAAQQLPLDWAGNADGSAWSDAAAALRAGLPLPSSSLPSAPPGGPQTPNQGAAQNPSSMQTSAQTAAQTAAQAAQAGAPGLAAAHSQASANLPPASLRFLAADVAALATSPHATAHQAAAQSDPAQSIAASIHAATLPLVRQQLDLLATGQFRWTGEAWPGARLDWTIEQDDDGRGRDGSDGASADDIPWRTRLTLSLPTLGTVDAELTLTGTQLFARVQASAGGATRLAAHGESFRQRLAAVGIALGALSIREIGGGATAVSGTDASGAGGAQDVHDALPRVTPQAAANAYARSASAAAGEAARVARAGSTAQVDSSIPHVDDFDWDMQ